VPSGATELKSDEHQPSAAELVERGAGGVLRSPPPAGPPPQGAPRAACAPKKWQIASGRPTRATTMSACSSSSSCSDGGADLLVGGGADHKPKKQGQNVIVLTGYVRPPPAPRVNGVADLDKKEINDAVSKVLQGYDWNLVPMTTK